MSTRDSLRNWEIVLILLFIVPKARTEINLALTGTASQSSEQDRSKWAAGKTIDNCTNQTIESGCCSHTKAIGHYQAWSQVDLKQTMTIQYITIYYRGGSASRFAGYSLYLSNSTSRKQGILCYKDNSIFASDVDLNPTHRCPYVARYVIVYNQRDTPKQHDWYYQYAVLELCEVQVYGCPIGMYGNGSCNNACSDRCFGGNCNPVSGACYYCFAGMYGDFCEIPCNAHCNNTCEKTSGHCIGCITGKTGALCDTDCPVNCITCNQTSATHCYECVNGKHGETCQLDCSDNCKDKTCMKDNGYCLECITGKYGNECENDCSENCEDKKCMKINGHCLGCVDGKYGDTCENECSNNCQNKSCKKGNGYCLACIPGKRGNLCETNCTLNCVTCNQTSGQCYECVVGKYGGMCGKDCSENCRDKKCMKNNGHCIECIPGKYNPTCSVNCLGLCKNNICQQIAGNCTDCPQGKYGSLCDKNCSTNCLNRECDATSGFCAECEDGYFGQNCNSQCETGCKTCRQSDGLCTVCDDGLYGGNCSLQCGNCEKCMKDTGYCLSTCASGYEGNTCLSRKMSPEPPSDNTGTIVGIIVGLLAAIAIVIISLFLIRRRRQNGAKEKPFDDMSQNRLPNPLHQNDINNDANVYASAALEENYVTETQTGDGNVYMNADDVTNVECTAESPTCHTNVYANTDDAIEGSSEAVYYNSGVTGTAIADFKAMVDTKMLKKAKAFEVEYESLPSGDLHENKIGMKSENKPKNRFKSTFPYDHSRVVLDKVDNDAHSDYINANYIDSVCLAAQYVATQGPIDKTVDDFWRMIWQLKSGKIVMLTNLVEGTKKKCSKYWPDEGEPMSTKHFKIVLDRERVYAFYVIRDITVTEKKTKTVRQIHQFHYTTWPDHGTPDPNELVVFHRRVISYENDLSGKMVVHCSAGIGRTGTFIALDALWTYGREFRVVDVIRYIKTMRKDRINMVQTSEQYIALHHILIEAFNMPDTLISREKYYTTLSSLQSGTTENQTGLRREYQLTQDLKPVYTEENYKTALLPVNRNKNKHSNILAVDKFRVYLSTPAPGRTNYINAVIAPSYTSRTGYIITQNPLENTVVDLLTVIMDNDCDTVVIIEKDNVEWLPEQGKDKSIGGFSLKHEGGSSNLSNTDVTEVSFSNPGHHYNSKVRVFHMSGWDRDESAPPDSQGLLQLLELVDSRRKSNHSKKTVVMCRDGYSQSGLFCCISNARDQMKTDEEVDIFQITRQLLVRRPEFITCYDQYLCCYNIIRDYLDTTDVYVN